MKKALICYSDELRMAAGLISCLRAVPGKTELWVLGGLGAFPAEDTGADQIVEVAATDETIFAEPFVCAQAIFELFSTEIPELLVTVSNLRGDELAAQLSVLTGGCCVLAAKALSCDNGGFVVQKSVFAGNLAADFVAKGLPLTVSLLPNGEKGKGNAIPERRVLTTDAALPDWLSDAEYRDAERTNSLSDAKLIIAAGRGAGNKAKLQKLSALSETLGGVLGGTRPVICEGKLPPDRQLGLSGSRVNPELCLVFGASGSAAFFAGIEGSGKIVAVNRDPQAPIFENCDLGVVADSAEFAEALTACLEQENHCASKGEA